MEEVELQDIVTTYESDILEFFIITSVLIIIKRSVTVELNILIDLL